LPKFVRDLLLCGNGIVKTPQKASHRAICPNLSQTLQRRWVLYLSVSIGFFAIFSQTTENTRDHAAHVAFLFGNAQKYRQKRRMIAQFRVM